MSITYTFFNIIHYLEKFGVVLTEHVGSTELSEKGELSRTDNDIFQRDLSWLQSADAVVAEVSTPSLGVGYELGIAEKLKIPVLCLYRLIIGKRLSAMINGNKKFQCQVYQGLDETKTHINNFFKKEKKT